MGIDRAGDRAVYRQLADLIRDQIVDGRLPAGASLPSEVRLRQEHGIGRETVRKAMAALRAEGLIVTVQGEGSRVRPFTSRSTIRVAALDRVIARMPSLTERNRLDLAEGAPVVDIRRAGGEHEVHAADQVEIVGTPPPGS